MNCITAPNVIGLQRAPLTLSDVFSGGPGAALRTQPGPFCL